MQLIFRQLLILVFVVLSGLAARAQGLVQLSLEGSIQPNGGALVEVLWETSSPSADTKSINLRLHLAQGTSAYDLGRLLSAELKGVGIGGVYPGDTPSADGATQLFVAHTSVLRLRLPPGLNSKVTACKGAPTRLRILRPDSFPGPGKITARTSTVHPHTQNTESVLLETSFAAIQPVELICEALFTQGLEKNLVVDRPTQDSWRPIRGGAGGVVIGCSIQLEAPDADWGLELRMDSALR